MSDTTGITPDADLRRRFVEEVDGNFSVIAPAGVGKTRAIVERVIHIALSDFDRAREWLPRLVVVTYTNKAAEEMQQRARSALVEHHVDLAILTQFNRAFFGTIHSFCARLLQSHGHYLGLPPRLEILEDENAMWADFTRRLYRKTRYLSDAARREALRYVPLKEIIRLAQKLKPWTQPPPLTAQAPPPLELDTLLAFPPEGRGAAGIAACLHNLKEWQSARDAGHEFVGLPRCRGGSKEFRGAWRHAFYPLRRWLAKATAAIACEIAADYRDYRLARACLTYDDQVELARRLLHHPSAGRAIRAEEYRVILDEAQDTDPLQFDVLIEVTRPADSEGRWHDKDADPPRQGAFCMVGDPQQAIYGDRADLEYYARVRNWLTKQAGGEELVFRTTFRCDRAIVDFVNRVGPAMLDGRDQQTHYVRLEPRPNCGPGTVIRRILTRPDDLAQRPTLDDSTRAEAAALAEWLAATGHAALGAEAWSQVAVLCPRISWLNILESAFNSRGLRTQSHSPKLIRGDRPAQAWFTALMKIMWDPQDSWEIVGVLREVFGLSDDALYRFGHNEPSAFTIEREPQGNGPVEETLRLLAQLRSAAGGLPLREASEMIVEQTDLRRRLAAIENDPSTSDREIDALLTAAAGAEAEKLSFREWVRCLEEDFQRLVEAPPVDPDALQLITCHKAKGLQWDAVILPLLFRGVGAHRDPYPQLLYSRPAEPPLVIMDGEEAETYAPRLAARRYSELQRLLYVAMTRARRTLVLCDDRELFPLGKNHDPLKKPGMADCLAKERKAVLDIMDSLESLPPSPVSPPAPESQGMAPADDKRRLTPEDITLARTNAAAFRARILPHALAKTPSPEDPETFMENDLPETPHAGAAREYGTWWHTVMEHINWAAGPSRWEETFTRLLPKSPDAERGRREWKLFLNSQLADRLQRPGLTFRSEMPFLWRKNPNECVEGLIDLAVYDPDENRWLVIDWKTNLVDHQHAQRLAEDYAPQIQAYVTALTGVTGIPAEGGIYSTALGKWLTCT